MLTELKNRVGSLARIGLLALAITLGVSGSAGALTTLNTAALGTGTLVSGNCQPVAAATDGTMVFNRMLPSGVDDAFIGNGNCDGTALLPPYPGNRGASDITRDGRYVLLVTAVGWDRTTVGAQPGKGSQNAIQLYDRQTGTLSTLLPSATPSQRGVIWPRFNADGTEIAWAQMVKTPWEENFPWGDWDLHVANVNLATGVLSDNRSWHDPSAQPGQLEVYGWIPGTNKLIFQSTQETIPGATDPFRIAQLYTLPDTFSAGTSPTRISPDMAPYLPGQQPVPVFHEFAEFAPNDPNTLYTSVGSDTLGGNDLFAYQLSSQQPNGLLGQATRISYFGGDPDHGYVSSPVPGWPTPAYKVVTMMAWVNGAWVAGVCPDMYCTSTSAYRITLPPPQASAAGVASGRAGGLAATAAGTRRSTSHRHHAAAHHRRAGRRRRATHHRRAHRRRRRPTHSRRAAARHRGRSAGHRSGQHRRRRAVRQS